MPEIKMETKLNAVKRYLNGNGNYEKSAEKPYYEADSFNYFLTKKSLRNIPPNHT